MYALLFWSLDYDNYRFVTIKPDDYVIEYNCPLKYFVSNYTYISGIAQRNPLVE